MDTQMRSNLNNLGGWPKAIVTLTLVMVAEELNIQSQMQNTIIIPDTLRESSIGNRTANTENIHSSSMNSRPRLSVEKSSIAMKGIGPCTSTGMELILQKSGTNLMLKPVVYLRVNSMPRRGWSLKESSRWTTKTMLRVRRRRKSRNPSKLTIVLLVYRWRNQLQRRSNLNQPMMTSRSKD